MSTFTPKGFAHATEKMANLAAGDIPHATLRNTGEKVRGIAAAASASSGGVKAPPTQFKFKPPKTTSEGTWQARVVGFGFAVLDEFGSYKKPRGYTEAPRKGGYGQTGLGRSLKENAKGRRVSAATQERRGVAAARYFGYSKVMLGDKATGFAAAYVHHPPIKAHPFQAGVVAAAGPVLEVEMSKQVVKDIAKAFG